MSTRLDFFSAAVFAAALLHSFCVSPIHRAARRRTKGSVLRAFLLVLGEIEAVFALWSAVLLAGMLSADGAVGTWQYLAGLSWSEPAFVGIILVMAGTRPVIQLAERGISAVAAGLPRISPSVAIYFSILTLGPLLGSLITEPAAMTVSAWLLKDRIYDRDPSRRLGYATIAVLFVNISIGGALTPFAAPPLLMVVHRFGWDFAFVFRNFGWKALLAVVLNAGIVSLIFRRELSHSRFAPAPPVTRTPVPLGLTAMHLALLAALVFWSHSPALLVLISVAFLAVTRATHRHQDGLRLREGAMVSLFLGGLVIIGARQAGWLSGVLAPLHSGSLFAAATGLTAIIDNAALTYLGGQVPNLAPILRYSLVAGALAGGGLTLIANAPNPAGYSLLADYFERDDAGGLSPLRLLAAALAPTAIAIACLGWL